MASRLLLLFVALVSAGCSLSTDTDPDQDPALRLSPGSEIVFEAERSEYRQGETARIVLRNRTDQPIGYNLCISARELRADGTWRRFEPLRVCTAALYSLAPGAEVVLQEPISTEWQPGEYRMVTTVELMRQGTRGEVFTSRFSVRR